MVHTQLITGTDLHERYYRHFERGLFPDLIRRLILASDKSVRWLHFRAHEGTALAGWDGLIDQADGATPYVPAGTSRWELGTNQDAAGKIRSDFAKRDAPPIIKAKKGRAKSKAAAAPEPAEPASAAALAPDPVKPTLDRPTTSLVFVVGRRWEGKEDWAREQTVDSEWRAVYVLDADDLETWLGQHPAIHIWLSTQMGKHVQGALDLENWWQDWAHQSQPLMQPDWLLAGRLATVNRFSSWVRGTDGTLSVFASTADEARAVIAACILTLPDAEREALLTRTLVVTDKEAWAQLARSPEALLLIPDFESANFSQLVAAATRNGHRVLLPRPTTEARNTDEVVTHLGREALETALKQAGFSSLDAAEKAMLARRSFTAFHRSILADKSLQEPWWAKPGPAAALLPLVLLGRWDAQSEGDQKMVELLTGEPYASTQHLLAQWNQRPGTPVRILSQECFVLDPADAWEQAVPYLMPPLQQRFAQVIEQVLGTPLARFNLPAEERSLASLRGVQNEYSSSLRAGLVATLALIATTNASPRDGNAFQLQAWAQHQIRQLLNKAFQDISGNLLASLNSILPTLAEVAPDIFLATILRELKQSNSVLPSLFQEEPGLFHPHAHHTGLLWALENLAWPAQHVSDATLALAGLARLDPGGSVSNRPINSLRNIFVGWHPQTNASVLDRLAVIDRLRSQEEEVAWHLMVRLMPSDRDVAWPSHVPTFHWRDWQINPDQRVTNAEYFDFVTGLTERLLADAGNNPDRWSELIDKLPELLNRVRVIKPELSAKVLEQLRAIGNISLSDDARSQLRTEIREFLNHHRSHPNTYWAWPEDDLQPFAELYNQLQPDDIVQRHAWIFDNWPRLPAGIREHGHEKSSAIVQQAQEEVVAEILAARGLAAVAELLPLVPSPYFLGRALALSATLTTVEKIALLKEYVATDDERLSNLGAGLASAYAWKMDADQAAKFAREQTADWLPAQRAIWLQVMPMTSETWQLAQEMEPAIEELFWKKAHNFVQRDEEAEEAVRQFLRFNRPVAAASVLAHMPDKPTLPTELVLETLEFIAGRGTEDDVRQIVRGYELSILLDALQNPPADLRARAIRMGFQFAESTSGLSNPKLLDQELQQNPNFFVEALAILYKRDDGVDAEVAPDQEQLEQPDQQERRALYAHKVWRMLHEWEAVPGSQPDQPFDPVAFHAWVSRASKLAEAASVMKGYNIEFGQILSHAPAGPDGVWPHPAVCEVLEHQANNESLHRHFLMGCYNRHGRAHTVDGGWREQSIAEQYTAWATAMQVHYPNTARLLRTLADDFYREAQAERDRHERDQQLGF